MFRFVQRFFVTKSVPKRRRKTPAVKGKRKPIPKAIREQVWAKYIGKKFEATCYVPWCKNKMDVFNYHVGHDVPVADGGENEISNLKPICARCNLSMSSNYTISEWNQISGKKKKWWFCNIL